MRPMILAGALALGVAGAAFAQSTMPHSGVRPGLMDMVSPGDPAAALPTSDYVMAAGQSDQFEIQEGQMASSMGRSPDVRAFGAMMIQAHRKTTADLARTVGVAGQPTPPPPPLTADQQAQIDQLRDLAGGEFDRVYVSQQIAAHQQALKVQADYARGGSDPGLRAAAKSTVPIVQSHLNRLRTLQMRVGA